MLNSRVSFKIKKSSVFVMTVQVHIIWSKNIFQKKGKKRKNLLSKNIFVKLIQKSWRNKQRQRRRWQRYGRRKRATIVILNLFALLKT
jgi:hypothetical protein